MIRPISTSTAPALPDRPHARAAAGVAADLDVVPASGLPDGEARLRLARFGPNALDVTPPPTFLTLLFRQFQSLLILLLLVAAGLSLLVGDPTDAAVILAVVALNALVGAVQEYRAERALDALQQMSAPTARVVRDGAEDEIAARDLVPGDVALVRSGDIVPGDGRLWSASSLQIDESTLTGESAPVEKDTAVVLPADTALPDRANMVFQGTAVTFGHGRFIVTATGAATEMGHLARSATATGLRATPLERQITWLGKLLSLLAVGASLMVFALGMGRGESLEGMFLIAVSLAVAAVPEGLPAVVTIVLAVGVQRMARRKAIVRRLAAVEALGSVTVICTDKTGTLTLGQMRVAAAVVNGHSVEAPEGRTWTESGQAAAANVPGWDDLLRAAILCNNARLGPTPAGDPTEQALLHWTQALRIDRDAVEHAWPRVAEIPFSSDRKRMTTVHRHDGTAVAYTKGAPDAVLAACAAIVTEGGERPITPDDVSAVYTHLERLAAQGLRLLALARRTLPDLPEEAVTAKTAARLESELTFLGLVGLQDPPRPEVPAALASARAAGIRVVMITGDYPATAAAIARPLGIEGGILTGAELEDMSVAALSAAAPATGIYARVAPQQKVQIVQAFQNQGHAVAMTGDGANDAPALRLADVGVAMGIRGTPVAKEAAAIVLADDHFATIIAAVEEGRTIYGNLRKVVLYLLSGNLGEVLVVFLAMAAGLPLPLQATQILWINLLTDALPALGLGMEPREPGAMGQPPRAPGESFLPGWTAPLIIVPSVLLALVTLAAFNLALARSPNDLAAAQSAAFTTLVLAHLGIGWVQRATLTSALRLPLWSNPILLAGLLGGVALLLPLLYTSTGQTLFDTQPLDATAWGFALLVAPVPFIGAEVAKFFVRRHWAVS